MRANIQKTCAFHVQRCLGQSPRTAAALANEVETVPVVAPLPERTKKNNDFRTGRPEKTKLRKKRGLLRIEGMGSRDERCSSQGQNRINDLESFSFAHAPIEN